MSTCAHMCLRGLCVCTGVCFEMTVFLQCRAGTGLVLLPRSQGGQSWCRREVGCGGGRGFTKSDISKSQSFQGFVCLVILIAAFCQIYRQNCSLFFQLKNARGFC